jgi:hypothetical protein
MRHLSSPCDYLSPVSYNLQLTVDQHCQHGGHFRPFSISVMLRDKAKSRARRSCRAGLYIGRCSVQRRDTPRVIDTELFLFDLSKPRSKSWRRKYNTLLSHCQTSTNIVVSWLSIYFSCVNGGWNGVCLTLSSIQDLKKMFVRHNNAG